MSSKDSYSFIQGGGEMGEAIRAMDWSNTAIGDLAGWPTALRIATGIMLATPFPMYIAWGPEYVQLYNDGYRPILGSSKHPQALGISTKETFAEIWHIIGSMFNDVMKGKAVGFPDFMLQLNRNGYIEECYFDFSYSPIPDEHGIIGGVLVTVIEVTEKRKAITLLKQAKDQVEMARIESEKQRERLNRFFMQAPAGVCILDGPDLTFELVNPSYQQLFPGRNLLGKPLLEAVPEIKDQPIFEILQGVYNNDKTFEGNGLLIPLARYDKGAVEDRYFNFIYQPRHNIRGDVDGILVFVFEVTEMIKTKLSLEESEKRFRSMVEQSPVPMLITKGAEMIFEEINPPMLKLIGRDDTVRNKPVFHIMPELKGQAVMENLFHTFYSGEPWTGYEVPIVISRDGKELQGYYNLSYKPLFEDGKVTGVLQSAIDVTDLVLARKEQEKIKDSLELSLLAARLGTFDVDMPTGLLECDKRCREFFYIYHDGPLQYKKDFLGNIHPDDHERVVKMIEEEVFVQSVSNGHFDTEFRNIGWKSEQTRWLRAMGKAYFNDAGKPVRFIGTMLDITEAKKDEIRKNDFIGMVSHELKTPLTSIHGYVQLLQHQSKNLANPATELMFEKAVRQLNKMNNMINGFLNISRLESGKLLLNKETFNLDKLIQDTLEDLRLTVTTHKISSSLCDVVEVYADRDKIGSVINNLLSNAIKYSPHGSGIEITCSKLEGNKVKVTVKDQGAGIASNDITKLFERYYRVQDTNSKTISGFGIGLYLSAEIIEHHGGEIGVESEVGKGSEFYFILPAEKG